MSFNLETTNKFERDLKRVSKRGLDMTHLRDVVKMLVDGETLPIQYKDHALTGNYNGYRECHIHPDWLLIYKKDTVIRLITLVRTGTHSDLF